MNGQSGIPKGAAIAINDMLDQCAKIKPGQDVVLLAHLDGLYGGDNLVDQEAISWIQTAIQLRGANVSILWIEEQAKAHQWRLPPLVKAALMSCDVFINNSFDIAFEELLEFKQLIFERKLRVIRNFATTAPLLCTAWAQTPNELVSEIRYQASLPIKEGLSWQLTADNGTHLEGTIKAAYNASHPWFKTYSTRREEGGGYLPWPEAAHPIIRLANTSGVFIFDCMLGWWSRYIGISPYFSKSIRLEVENGKIIKIEGGTEAEALRRFVALLYERLGDKVYNFDALHFGVHPQAYVGPHQCPNVLYRRLIEGSHTSNIHVHVGGTEATQEYPYWVHITGDIRTATFRVGDTVIHDKGYLKVLDDPILRTISDKYPGRPGLAPEPKSY